MFDVTSLNNEWLIVHLTQSNDVHFGLLRKLRYKAFLNVLISRQLKKYGVVKSGSFKMKRGTLQSTFTITDHDNEVGVLY